MWLFSRWIWSVPRNGGSGGPIPARGSFFSCLSSHKITRSMHTRALRVSTDDVALAANPHHAGSGENTGFGQDRTAEMRLRGSLGPARPDDE